MAMAYSRDPATAQMWAQDNSGGSVNMDPRWGDLGGYGTADAGQGVAPGTSMYPSASDQWMAAQRRLGYDPMTGGSTSLATGSTIPGGQFNADKQLAAVRSEFDQILKRGQGQLDEDLAARGIYSGGVGADLSNQFRTQVGNQQSAAIERIMNDILGRNQSFALEQQRLAMGQGFSAGRGQGQTFGNGGQDQQILDLYNRMGGDLTGRGSNLADHPNSGEGYADGSIVGGGGMYSPSFGSPEPVQNPGESMSSYYKRLNAWHAVQRRGY